MSAFAPQRVSTSARLRLAEPQYATTHNRYVMIQLRHAVWRTAERIVHITVFDPERIRDRATYQNSAQRSEGIHYVLVAGALVVDKGELVPGVKPGQLLRHE